MTEPRLLTAGQVDPEQLHGFLERFFGPVKAAFLRDHGAWWHRGEDNRMVLTVEGEVAGYCAVIPTRCQVGDRSLDAVWWMDLVIDPKFRGQRLQSLLDVEVRRRSELLLGFPNALAAVIHRKHGWGVREDLASLVAPLRPLGLNAVRRTTGLKGVAVRGVAALAAGPFRLRRALLAGRDEDGELVRREVAPSAPELARIARLQEPSITAIRDADFLRWRYLEAPVRDQLRIFTAGPAGQPRVAAILRLLPPELGGAARLLDVFGELRRDEMVLPLLRRIVCHGAAMGAPQITALAAHSRLARQLRRSGFWLRGPARFCWWSGDAEIMRLIAQGNHHWVVGDSDHDEPR
jgi:hypothetical protein